MFVKDLFSSKGLCWKLVLISVLQNMPQSMALINCSPKTEIYNEERLDTAIHCGTLGTPSSDRYQYHRVSSSEFY